MLEATTPEAAPIMDTQPEAVEAEVPEVHSGAEDSDAEFATSSEDAETETPLEQPRYTVKVDGKEAEVTLDELRNGYQRQADYTAKTQELAERKRELSARTERWDSAIQQGEMLVNVLAQEFQADFNGINWTELAHTDPAQWAHKTQLKNDRIAKLQHALAVLQQTKQAKAAEHEATEAQRITEEESNLLSKIPEWKNAEKRSAEAAELSRWMIDQGYTREDLQSLNRGRHLDVVIARKAMLYDRMVAKAPKPAAVPKAPPPIQKAATRATGPKDPAQMTDKEFAEWRKRQIAQRR